MDMHDCSLQKHLLSCHSLFEAHDLLLVHCLLHSHDQLLACTKIDKLIKIARMTRKREKGTFVIIL